MNQNLEIPLNVVINERSLMLITNDKDKISNVINIKFIFKLLRHLNNIL